MELIQNLINNYKYLQQDYVGISINFYGIVSFLTNCITSIILIVVFFLVGSKIKETFFSKINETIDFFIKIALGYIFIASGLLILGMLGMFYKSILYLYYAVLIIVALHPLNTLKNRLNTFPEIFNEYRKQFINNKLVNIAILGFMLVGFLRVIPPEVGVDAIWYHTDYPRLYLNSHSMMSIDPIGKYYPGVVPALSDMLYIITQSLDLKDSSRFIHFSFYILSVSVYLIVFKKRYPIAPFAAFLFVTSPTIIKFTSSAYAESTWIFCWLLAVFIIISKIKFNLNEISLIGILIGGTLATKLWMIPFYGVFVLYFISMNIKENKVKLLKLISLFTIFSFSIPFLWYLRAFIITGNPLFPTFWSYPNGEFNSPAHLDLDLKSIKERIGILTIVSPFSIIGFIFLFSGWTKLKKAILKNKSLVIFTVILTITQILINYNYPRFVIPFYSILAIILAFGIYKFTNLNKYFRYLFYILWSLFFLYYFINILFILPYGFGWANENKYLTRVLSRDNSSYYDYNNQFSKLIGNKDLVATYNLWGFYYANFKYMYTEDIFRKGSKSLKILEKLGANKLLIRGGDIEWLCKTEKLIDCSSDKYKLLTSYLSTTDPSVQYLYELYTK